jgi:hypothetical protein
VPKLNRSLLWEQLVYVFSAMLGAHFMSHILFVQML